jgi:hypothetical protein
MGIEGNDTVSTHGGIPQDRDVTCTKCGRTAKPSHGWVMGSDGAILCAVCHRDLISQNIDDRYEEMFGHEMAHYFSSLRKHNRVKAGEKSRNESHS